ncbi:MAG: hypothetical protein J2P46_08635 [Zavarzinella sp.]|nr:hypothetical protein [Zavarzinella sp.]
MNGFKWLKEENAENGDDLPEPEDLAVEAIGDLKGAKKELEAVVELLEGAAKR